MQRNTFSVKILLRPKILKDTAYVIERKNYLTLKSL